MPNFFIDRPIFAWVIAGGAISDDCAASNFHYRHVPRC